MIRAHKGRLSGILVAMLAACTFAEQTTGVSDAVTVEGWPGPVEVTTMDLVGAFGSNLSGLAAASEHGTLVLWAVRNAPAQLYRVLDDGEVWRADTASGWAGGRLLRYPN